MTSRPTSIRNVPWAVVRDAAARRHVYRRDVDLFLKDGHIAEITPAGARRQAANEPALDGRSARVSGGPLTMYNPTPSASTCDTYSPGPSLSGPFARHFACTTAEAPPQQRCQHTPTLEYGSRATAHDWVGR